jgi:hypothetical protein
MQGRRKGREARTRVSGKVTGCQELRSSFSCDACTARVLPRARRAAKPVLSHVEGRRAAKREAALRWQRSRKSLSCGGYLTLRRLDCVALRGSACVVFLERVAGARIPLDVGRSPRGALRTCSGRPCDRSDSVGSPTRSRSRWHERVERRGRGRRVLPPRSPRCARVFCERSVGGAAWRSPSTGSGGEAP